MESWTSVNGLVSGHTPNTAKEWTRIWSLVLNSLHVHPYNAVSTIGTGRPFLIYPSLLHCTHPCVTKCWISCILKKLIVNKTTTDFSNASEVFCTYEETMKLVYTTLQPMFRHNWHQQELSECMIHEYNHIVTKLLYLLRPTNYQFVDYSQDIFQQQH